MIEWRAALAAALAAAAVAGCIAYLSETSPQVEANQQPLPVRPNLPAPDKEASKNITDRPTPKEKGVEAFERAVEAILRREVYAGAAAGVPPIKGRVPLPKRRPIPRQ